MIGLIWLCAWLVTEVRLNQRQRAFLDAVTHEMKTPLASFRLGSGMNAAPGSVATLSARPSSGSAISSAPSMTVTIKFSVSPVMPRPPGYEARGPEADR